jgi:hypothetical protein
MMALEQMMAQAVYTAYRLGGYAMLNLVEDPALLAILFC